MFNIFNPFRYLQAKKRARLEAEKQIALRKERQQEAAREAKRRQEYADHLEELRRVVKQPRVRLVPEPPARRREYQPTYSGPDSDSVSTLLNSISEQSRVTAFEMGSTDTGSTDRSDCSSASDSGSSSSSDGGGSCGSGD